MRKSIVLVALALSSPGLYADTVVLKSGKKFENVVVSVNDDSRVVINPWNSRSPDMKWEVGKENTFSKDDVKEVVIADPPRIEYLRLAGKRPLDATAHLEIARFCEKNGMKDERTYHLESCLALDPTNQEALATYTEAKWKSTLLKNPALSETTRQAAQEYVSAEDDAAAKDAWTKLVRASDKRPQYVLERARRSAKLPKGKREKVKLTIESEKSPGATYAIHVPKSYDPLVPTPLVIALHGGGPGGVDATVVEGSGEDALPFYVDPANEWGWIVVCPTALVAPWGVRNKPINANVTMIRSLLTEIEMLYNIDLTRVYVTGHSMGGFGSWFFGSKYPEWWTACAPCAGGGGPDAVLTNDLPVYVYHGSDDPVVPVGSDRNAASLLRGDGKKKVVKDFVYTELDGVKHSFPEWVRKDIFRWFAGRANVTEDRKKKFLGPISSFESKPTKLEIDAFGDPEKPFAARDKGGDESLKALLADLQKGGATGEQALTKLLEMKDEKTARQIAPLLTDKKSSVDTRVLATRALAAGGAAAANYVPKLLAPAIDDPDRRVVDAAIDTLGAIGNGGGKDLLTALGRCSARCADLFAASYHDGTQIEHTEYVVRLESFARVLSAYEKVADPSAKDSFLTPIERDLVKPIFLPKVAYTIPGDADPRFKDVSKDARLDLVKALSHCLVLWKDPRGADLLLSIARHDPWSNEPKLVAACEAGATEIRP